LTRNTRRTSAAIIHGLLREMFGWLKRKITSTLRDGLNEWRDPQGEENPMACPEITIEGIDDAMYAKLMNEAVAGGAQFNGNIASIDGLTFDWNRDSVTQTLHITCLKKEFFITCKTVESKIRELVQKSKEAL
jgi:hypothetical protein